MNQFFKKIIKKHIETLKREREGFIMMLSVYPKDSFCYGLLNFELKHLEFKMVICETLI